MRDVWATLPSFEEWRCVTGYEGLYDVSSFGRVRSRHGGGLRILAPVRQRQGYLSVVLFKDGEKKRHSIHRLVCIEFNGPQPEGCEVGHSDGSKDNNDRRNLRWVTKAENYADKVKHGYVPHSNTHHTGERHPSAKLTADHVREIRASNMGHKPIARLYGVSDAQIRRIRKGEKWQTA